MKRIRPLEILNFVLMAAYFGVLVFIMCAFMSLLLGCATADPGPVPKDGVVYLYDLKGTVNGTAFDGVGVVPYSQTYDIKIESKVDVDLLEINSCGRNFHQESAITSGWFKPRRAFEYVYQPDPTIENYGSCLVRFRAYNKAQGQNAWGIVDFETPDAALPAAVFCNGSTRKSNGVSICQSKAGVIQKISFQVAVRQAPAALDPRCRMTSVDGMSWEYAMPSGECVMAFMEVGGTHRVHRHTTVAYTDYQIRGN
jgi:hypothetical protein